MPWNLKDAIEAGAAALNDDAIESDLDKWVHLSPEVKRAKIRRFAYALQTYTEALARVLDERS